MHTDSRRENAWEGHCSNDLDCVTFVISVEWFCFGFYLESSHVDGGGGWGGGGRSVGRYFSMVWSAI